MTAESPTNLTRPHAQPRPWEEDHGREVREFSRRPRVDGDYPTDDSETPGNSDRDHPVANADAAPSRQEYPLYDAAREEAHWEATHDDQPYADSGDFTDFSAAYRNGYEGFNQLGADNRFDDVEDDLQEEYEAEGNFIPWEDAREASRAAWDRLEERRTKAEKDTGWPVP